ncbi:MULTISPECIES: hypothetical protein [unclassified Ruegeria]|uniref:hypothetical protein n=1 Tax=unclassified Ruegeria TaxID=2625375 RepID=UPI001487A8DC|nr:MULTISPECIES: hypothetical protein [unclassified Ruegeria]NOD75727.1 hypothetical protein [Ruegeria sp. HKCCD4332]NOD88962.1 hypothetical protein [Ruegeria sp. HKCCD4318]NOE14452.1 hypothetical protein [Ruegeria sp. HKCCD4318-2]NOG10027.1 hypothetical protein [Ruegeria sp. HKCCD4315]
MTRTLPTIASFWFGSDLTWLEQICIRSFLDQGHAFVLYLPHETQGIPAGVQTRPASDVFWPPPFPLQPGDRQGVAVFSDIFRLHLIQQSEVIWVDLDAYCVKAFDFSSDWVFARSKADDFPTGVLRLPNNSQTLGLMQDFVMSANPTQPWRGRRARRHNRERIANGESWGIESLPWGSSGPKAFGHFLRQTGEDKYAMAAETLYPLAPAELWKLHDPNVALVEIEGEVTHSVHVYGHQKKLLATQLAGLPVPGSYLDALCARHGIDSRSAPIKPLDWMRPAPRR